MMDNDYRRKYRCKYTFEYHLGKPLHMWSLVGSRGGVHLHITDYGDEHGRQYGDRYLGGIEIHWRNPPSWSHDSPPDNDRCWLLEAPCWHDGSSLQASERFIPAWLVSPNDHDAMFQMLAQDADYHFREEKDYADSL